MALEPTLRDGVISACALCFVYGVQAFHKWRADCKEEDKEECLNDPGYYLRIRRLETKVTELELARRDFDDAIIDIRHALKRLGSQT